MTHTATVADVEREKERFKAHGIASGWPESRYEQTWGRNGTYEFKHIAVRCDFDIWLAAKADARAAGAPAETAKAKAVQRYDLVEKQHGSGHMVYFEKEMESDPEGGGVKFADLAAPQIDATTAPAEMADCGDCEGTGRLSGVELCQRCNESGILPATAPDVAKDAARAQRAIADIRRFVDGSSDDKLALLVDDDIETLTTYLAAMGALPPTGSEKA